MFALPFPETFSAPARNTALQPGNVAFDLPQPVLTRGDCLREAFHPRLDRLALFAARDGGTQTRRLGLRLRE